MDLFRLLQTNPLLFIAVAAILLYSIIAHEVAHGAVALLFGDDTAKRYGRLTPNPLPHLDPIGTLMLFIVGFGWAKPVPVDYEALGRSRFAVIAVALAGCLTNILIAFAAIFLSHFPAVGAHSTPAAVLSIVARINIILGAFNLIPIPPLDGSKVLMGFLPWETQQSLARLEPYGFFLLIFFLFTGLLTPLITALQNAIYGFADLLFGLFR
jgi:Zn-dependent protease